MKKFLLLSAALLVGLFLAVELFARFYLGLGDPPLSVADPQIEYLFKPSSSYRRFGNHIRYNAYSMRSDDFPAKKSDPTEIRILLLGDSVINGGSQTDQADLATSILQQQLRRDLARPVIVANISAGSWGPPNELAYLKKFGLFDADMLILCQSSHDYADAPTFNPVVGVSPDFPGDPPLLAITEAVTRYLPRYLPGRHTPPPDPQQTSVSQKDIDWCLTSLKEMIDLAKSAGIPVILVQHLETTELTGTLMPGHDAILAVAQRATIPIIQLGPPFANAQKAGNHVYRDEIHPTAAGQKLIAETLLPVIESTLKSRATPMQPSH